MPLYKASQTAAAPLLMQLSTGYAIGAAELHTPNRTCFIVELAAEGETASGAASRPVLYRPSSPGTASVSLVPIPVDPASFVESPASHTQVPTLVVTSFSVSPSLPVLPSGSYNLPMNIRWVAPPKQAIVVYGNASVVFYAAASGGHTWSGEMGFID